jgi:hypothetical protein
LPCDIIDRIQALPFEMSAGIALQHMALFTAGGPAMAGIFEYLPWICMRPVGTREAIEWAFEVLMRH